MKYVNLSSAREYSDDVHFYGTCIFWFEDQLDNILYSVFYNLFIYLYLCLYNSKLVYSMVID